MNVKNFFILLLHFVAGLIANIIAGYVQQDVLLNIFTPQRILVGVIFALLMLALITILKNKKDLVWNWRWHRFWYFRGLLNNRKFEQVKIDYNRLDSSQGKRRAPRIDVLVDGKPKDLIKVLKRAIEFRDEGARIIILGEPGSGKTTCLKKLTFDLANVGKKQLWNYTPIPIPVELGNFKNVKLEEHIKKTLEDSTTDDSGKVLSKGLDLLMRWGHIVLLFDALDETPSKWRDEVLSGLAGYIEAAAFSKMPIIITTRTREDPGQRLKNKQVYKIQELSDESINDFVALYKHQNDSINEIITQLKKHKMLDNGGLGRNPFWLRRIIDSRIFNGSKGEILNQSVDYLLKREVDKPDSERYWERKLDKSEQIKITKQGLAILGFYLWESKGKVNCTEKEALNEIARWIKTQTGLEKIRPQDILGLGNDAQILYYYSPVIQFRHQLLQDFMIAWAISMEKDLLDKAESKEDKLKKKLVNEMLTGIIKDQNSNIQKGAVEALGKIGDANVVESLINILDHKDNEIQLEAKNALIKLGKKKVLNRKVINKLNEALQTQKLARERKKNIIEVLSEISDETSIVDIINEYDDLPETVIQAIKRIGKPATDFLSQKLEDPSWDIANQAAEILKNYDESRFYTVLATFNNRVEKLPFKDCPVCEGIGKVDEYKYVETGETNFIQCVLCRGTGRWDHGISNKAETECGACGGKGGEEVKEKKKVYVGKKICKECKGIRKSKERDYSMWSEMLINS